MTWTGCSKRRRAGKHACLEDTSQRTRSWNVARRQLTEGDFGVCERYIFFHVALRELTKVDFGVREVYQHTF